MYIGILLVGGGVDVNEKEPYLLAYLLDNDTEKHYQVEEIACKYNLKIINIGISETGQKVLSIENWLKLIEKSSYVTTDSFHGTVFSILFNKPFYVLGNNSRGNSRFNSLLEFTGLMDRVKDNSIDTIDWQIVNEKVSVERKRCCGILKEKIQ